MIRSASDESRHRLLTTAALLLALFVAAPIEAADPHVHGDHHAGVAQGHSVADFEAFGVRLATVGSGAVDLGIELPGEVRPNAERVAHLAPQFPGMAREVRKRIGDSVRAGDVLAVVESQNLSRFEIKAAFEGTVLERHINPGETVHPQAAAFVVADLSTVWVEVSVFQAALSRVAVGQPVWVSADRGGPTARGTLSYIAPIIDPETRSASARVVLSNDRGDWRPGLFVRVTALEPVEVPMVVPRRALHQLDGQIVLFVADGEELAPRAVRVGRLGGSQAEILAGVVPGDRYADENSFLVKAELGKSAAEHEH
jgi:cobalt-zinc-cadmium efflux system membrane fusion protein